MNKKRFNIIRCTFQADNGYTILLCDLINEKGRAVETALTLVGNFLPTNRNHIFLAETEEVYNKKYGKQLKVVSYEDELPKDKEGILETSFHIE